MKKINKFIMSMLALFCVSFGILPQVAAQGVITFNANGTFTVPPGVTSVTYKIWAAGGGAGLTPAPNGSGGGGGGAYVQVTRSNLTPGTTYAVTVGTGGAPGSDGGASSVDGSTAQGGRAGIGSGVNQGFGGRGGSSTNAPFNVVASGANFSAGSNQQGGDGGSSTSPDTRAGGEGGGGAIFGSDGSPGNSGGTSPNTIGGSGGSVSGGDGGNLGANGANGGAIGGGGGGKGEGASTTGGSGANGRVEITYTCPTLTSISYTNVLCNYSSPLTETILPASAQGGTFSCSTLVGFLNTINGDIAIGAPQGSHVITYQWPAANGCPAASVNTTLVIGAQTTVTSFSYATPYCTSNNATVTPTFTFTGTAGVFSYTGAGTLGGFSTANGSFNPSTSTPGSYTVTYTVTPPVSGAGSGCNPVTATATLVVTEIPTLSAFDYPGDNTYCAGEGLQLPSSTITNPNGNTISYSSTAGLTISATSGEVNPATSTPGVYTVTMTIAAGAGCAAVSSTTTVEILARPTATIAYGAAAFCQVTPSVLPPIAAAFESVTISAVTGGPLTGGTFSATPAGLNITASGANAGRINLNSAVGVYSVKYMFTGANGCVDSSFTTVTIKARPTATLTTANATTCSNINPTLGGNVVAVGAWTLTLSNGQTATGTGSGPWSIVVNTQLPGTTVVYFVQSLIDANGCPANQIQDLTGTTTIIQRGLTAANIDGAANVYICTGQAANVLVELSGALSAPSPSYTGTFLIDVWDGSNWVPSTPAVLNWSVVFPVASGGNVIIPAGFLPNTTNSVTIQYRVGWGSLLDGNGCSPDPLTGFVYIFVAPKPAIVVSAAPVGDVCPGTNITFDVNQTGSIVGALFNWVAKDASNNVLGQAFNVAFGPNAINTNLGLSCPTNKVVTFTISPIGPQPYNCGGPALTRVVNVRDVQAPTWLTALNFLNRTLECSDAAGLTAAQLLKPTAQDNCDNDVTNIVKVSGAYVPSVTCPQAGTYTNTWTVTDECGNVSAVYTQVITIVDTQAPTWITLANALNGTFQCSDAAGIAGAQALFPVAQDNCDANVTNIVKVSGAFVASVTCPQAGTYTNTWTVKDDCGNTSAVFTQVITIIDTQAPTWLTAVGNLNRTLECSDLAGLSTAQGLFPVAQDNCDANVTNIVKISGAFVASVTCPQAGTYTNTWTVKDDCGNTSVVYTQVITIQDTQAPTWLTAVGNLNRTLECSDLAGLSTAQGLFPTAQDNCDANVTNIVKISGAFVASVTCPQAGTYTNTWTVKDDCGNTSVVYTQVITIQDTQAPTWLTAVGNLNRTIECSNTAAIATAQALFPTAQDNCDANVTNIVKVSGAFVPTLGCPQSGTFTNTWTVKDDCGNTSVVYTQVITITDLTAPALTGVLPTGSTGLGINGCIGSAPVGPTAAAIALLYTDLCGTVMVTKAGAVTGTDCAWTVTYVYTVKDNCGNTVVPSPSITYYGSDRSAPVFTSVIPTQTINTGAGVGCSGVMPDYRSLVTYTDCSPTVTLTQLAPNAPGTGVFGYNGTRNVEIEARDACGNKDTIRFVVLLKDLTPPVMLCKNWVLTLDAMGNATLTIPNINNGTYDNCTPTADLILSLSKTSFNCSNVGVNTVKLYATDLCNNIDSCTATVTVRDLTAPVISCWGDTTINKDANCTHTIPDLTFRVNKSDACGIATVTQFPTIGSIMAASIMSMPVTITVTDVNGNVSTCTFLITYKDVTPPVITGCPGNIIVNTGLGNTTCSAPATWIAPTATDACIHCCTTQSIVGSHVSGAIFPVGVTTVTYTATDISGNVSTCTFTVTVVDNTKPIIAGCPTANVTANTGAGATLCSATATWTEPTATDNCTAAASLVRTRSHAPGSIFPVGTTVVTYTFTDLAGNVSNVCSFNVVVTDNTPPTFTACPANIANPPINAAGCLATVATANPTTFDNCGVVKLTWAITGAGITPVATSPTTGINFLGTRTFNFGVTTVTYTATDAAGLTATCSFTVTVTRPLAGVIAGTSTVLQNISGTSTVSFTATSGTAPYVFAYTTTAGGFPSAGLHTITTTGLNSSTIGGNPNSLVTTVPQSNASVGVYTYTLVSVTDAFGCVVNPGTTAVITVNTNIFPRADFTPSISSLAPTFLQPAGVAAGYLGISNISPNPSSGTVSFNVFAPINFNLNIGASTTSVGGVAVDNSDFNIVFYPGQGYAISTKPGVIIPANSMMKVGYTVSATGNVNTAGQMSILLLNGTGGSSGDDNNSNNRGIINYSIIP
jgi:HYR domain